MWVGPVSRNRNSLLHQTAATRQKVRKHFIQPNFSTAPPTPAAWLRQNRVPDDCLRPAPITGRLLCQRVASGQGPRTETPDHCLEVLSEDLPSSSQKTTPTLSVHKNDGVNSAQYGLPRTK